MEQVRAFLRGYLADAESLTELPTELTRLAEVNPDTVRRRLDALDALLADPPADGTLARLVAGDANWVLDDESSDAAAARWLTEVADVVRAVVAQNPPA
ncbi:hypothetical protein [Micromonospora sp. NPDC093277]|uniref:hypothetical protein n=1 Tax=Micromonospora sp. NPDC093277 TaxID=3364291 RepID=UPI003825BAD3